MLRTVLEAIYYLVLLVKISRWSTDHDQPKRATPGPHELLHSAAVCFVHRLLLLLWRAAAVVAGSPSYLPRIVRVLLSKKPNRLLSRESLRRWVWRSKSRQLRRAPARSLLQPRQWPLALSPLSPLSLLSLLSLSLASLALSRFSRYSRYSRLSRSLSLSRRHERFQPPTTHPPPQFGDWLEIYYPKRRDLEGRLSSGLVCGDCSPTACLPFRPAFHSMSGRPPPPPPPPPNQQQQPPRPTSGTGSTGGTVGGVSAAVLQRIRLGQAGVGTGSERTIAEKFADSNRPTWEQYKTEHHDKLNVDLVDAQLQEQYRRELERDREKRMGGGKGGGSKKEAKKKSSKKSKSKSKHSRKRHRKHVDDERKRQSKRRLRKRRERDRDVDEDGSDSRGSLSYSSSSDSHSESTSSDSESSRSSSSSDSDDSSSSRHDRRRKRERKKRRRHHRTQRRSREASPDGEKDADDGKEAGDGSAPSRRRRHHRDRRRRKRHKKGGGRDSEDDDNKGDDEGSHGSHYRLSKFFDSRSDNDGEENA